MSLPISKPWNTAALSHTVTAHRDPMHLPSCCLRYSTCMVDHCRRICIQVVAAAGLATVIHLFAWKRKETTRKPTTLLWAFSCCGRGQTSLDYAIPGLQATAENLTLFLSCLYRNKKLIKGKLISDFIQSQNTPNWKGPIRIIWLTSSHVPVTIKFFLTF